MNLFQIAEHIQSNDVAKLFLRQRHIIRWDPPICPGKNGNPCGREMREYFRRSRGTTEWQCSDRYCRKRMTAKKDSF